MRRRQAVRDGQPGDERNPQPNQSRAPSIRVASCLPRQREQYRREQDQTYLKKYREPNDETGKQQGPIETALAESPRHPYTQALFASAPSMDPDRRMDRPPIAGDPPNPIDPPSGCRFRTRCPFAMPRCAEAPPPFVSVDPGHEVACYLYELTPAARG